MSRIITFYSYKGGVGRTFALVNIALLLAKRGKKVLLMDWDLEAPGMDRYFRPYLSAPLPQDKGIIHLLHEASANPEADWRSHVISVTAEAKNVSPISNYELSLLPSGVAAIDYAEKVRSFSWQTFFAEQKGGPIFERWRQEWKQAFDFILLDSRTGITDSGGVCTILLPDFLALVFTANEQSLEGSLSIVASAQEQRQNLSVKRPPLSVLPLLSRFDGRVEVELSGQWLERIAVALNPLYADWLPRPYTPLQMIEKTKIPYVSRFSFGDPLPVLTHSLTDSDMPGLNLEHSARLLLSDFQEAAQIIDPEAQAPLSTTEQLQALIQQAPFDELVLHQMLRDIEAEQGEGPELAGLLDEAASALQGQARYAVAEPLFRRALAMLERYHGSEHTEVAALLNNLSILLMDTNRLAEAEPMMLRALAICERSFGPEHPNVATNLNNLAQLLQDTNRLAEAEPLMRRALAIDELSFGPEHPKVAIRLNNLATLLQATKRLDEAEPLMRQALAIDERNFGMEHPNVAIRLNNLALLLQATNRLAEAEPLLRRALAIDELSFGPEHPNVAVQLNNLALLLQVTNRLDEAEPLYRRALAIGERSFGLEHPNFAIRLNNLAMLLQDTNRLNEAEPLTRRAVLILLRFTHSTGHIHPELRKFYRNYRQLLDALALPQEQVESGMETLRTEVGFDRAEWQSLQERLSEQ